jgi:hypothetical protein
VLGEPTDEELIAFAETLLADFRDSLGDPEVIREAVAERPDLWRTLYAISRDMEHHGGPPA